MSSQTLHPSRLRAIGLSLVVTLSVAFAPHAALAEATEAPNDGAAIVQEEAPASTPDATEAPAAAPSSDAPSEPVATPTYEQTPVEAPSEPVETPAVDAAAPSDASGEGTTEFPAAEDASLAAPATDEAGTSTDADANGEALTTPEPTSAEAETAPAEGLDAAAAPTDSQPDTAREPNIATDAAGQTFFIESSKSDPTVVEAAGGKMAKGTNIQAHSFNGSVAQMWQFVMSGKTDKAGNPYYLIVSGKDTTMCLDVAGGKTDNGTNVRLWKKNGSDAQLWSIMTVNEQQSLVSIVSKLSEKAGKTMVIELKGGKTANGTNIQLYKSNNSAAQRFYLVSKSPKVKAGDTLPDGDGVYSVRLNANTGFATDVKGGSKDNGGNIQLWTYNGSDAQRLIFRNDGTGFYTIGVLGSAKVFEVAGAKVIPGTNIQQNAANGSDAQKWALRKNANGSYQLVNKATGLALDIAGGTVAKGSNIQGYRPLTSARQQFRLVKDTKPLIPEGIVTISPFSNTAMVFDIANASKVNGGKLRLWTSNGSIAQRFEVIKVGHDTYRIRTAASGGWLTSQGAKNQVVQMGGSATEDTADLWRLVFDQGGYFSLLNVRDNVALDLRSGSTAKGAIVQLYASKGVAAQHFVFKTADLIASGVYAIRSFHGTQVDVVNASTAPAHLQTIAAKDHVAQKFKFSKKNGAYQIVNLKSGLLVSATGDQDKTSVTQKRDKGTTEQLWRVQIADGGFLKLVNVANGMSMATRGAAAGSNVVQRAQGESPNGERWKLVATSGTVATPPQPSTRILMIGNSLTYREGKDKSGNAQDPNNLPTLLAKLLATRLGCQASDIYIEHCVQGGKGLVDHLTNPDTNYLPGAADSSLTLATRTYRLLDGGDWDYVIFQDKSDAAVVDMLGYVANVVQMATLIRSCGATPILYGTWAFSDKMPSGDPITTGVNPLAELADGAGMTRTEMQAQLQQAFHSAADAAEATLANVGKAFYDMENYWNLYASVDPDARHAGQLGVRLAADEIAETLQALMRA